MGGHRSTSCVCVCVLNNRFCGAPILPLSVYLAGVSGGVGVATHEEIQHDTGGVVVMQVCSDRDASKQISVVGSHKEQALFLHLAYFEAFFYFNVHISSTAACVCVCARDTVALHSGSIARVVF